MTQKKRFCGHYWPFLFFHKIYEKKYELIKALGGGGGNRPLLVDGQTANKKIFFSVLPKLVTS